MAWDDRVGDLLGEAIPNMRREYHAATFKHLLAHRSRLQANIQHVDFNEFGQNPPDPLTDRCNMARLALLQAPVAPIGSAFNYFNNGYVVAAAMLEARTGKSWEYLLVSEVFEPLDIKSADFGPPGQETKLSAPRGHRMKNGRLRAVGLDVDNPAALGPAGRVHMNLVELARYAETHRRRDPEFLRKESYEILHQSLFGGDYAMGRARSDAGILVHDGSNKLWYSMLLFWPARGVVAVVTTNTGESEAVPAALQTMMHNVLDDVVAIGGAVRKPAGNSGVEVIKHK